MNTQPNNPNPSNAANAPDPLAVALSKLDPAPHGFEWNALMFAAGRASKARALLFWRVTAGVCTIAACGFALALFTRLEIVTVRDHVVYVDRAPQKTEPPVVPVFPLPVPAPVVPPTPKTEVKPESPSPVGPLGWSFDPPPEQGVATRWLTMRNEVLTVGLSVLPDPGRKGSPPRMQK